MWLESRSCQSTHGPQRIPGYKIHGRDVEEKNKESPFYRLLLSYSALGKDSESVGNDGEILTLTPTRF